MLMAVATPENMRSVYHKLLEAGEVKKIELRANEKPADPIHAEIAGKGQWIVVVTAAGQEHVASGHLIGRGFGVYQPREPKEYIRRGQKVAVMRSMYQSYLFVYVWGVEKQFRRIKACTGVSRILCIGEDTPATVPWSFIDRIRAEENSKNPLVLPVDETKPKRRKFKGKKGQHRYDEAMAEWAAGNEVIGVRSWGFSKSQGTWDEPEPDAEALARKAELHKVIGLAA